MRKIDAERLKSEIFKASMDDHFMPVKLLDCDTVTEIIDNAPTIEEPIRCKECIWWTKADDSLQGRCSMFGMYPTGTWFCANAERKEQRNDKRTSNTLPSK